MQIESALANNYRNILDNLPCGVYMTDRKRQLFYWNRAAERISGFQASEVIGSHCYDNILMHIDEEGTCLCQQLCPLAKTIMDGIPREGDVFLHHKDGHRISVKINTIPLKAEDGTITGCAEIFTDTSQFDSVATRVKELERIAFHDSLSNLPNREHMESQLDLNFHEFRRLGQRFGVLFLDIDNFKNFNDRFGHEAGDRIIRTVANTLRGASRPFDVFGRWGGEEFVGIIKHVDPQKLDKVGNRYRKLIEKSSISIKNKQVGITVSIGATVVRKNDTEQTIINRADRLMYECKRKGRNCLASDSD